MGTMGILGNLGENVSCDEDQAGRVRIFNDIDSRRNELKEKVAQELEAESRYKDAATIRRSKS